MLTIFLLSPRYLAGVTQGDGEQVLQIEIVHFLLWALVDRNNDLPRSLHLLQAIFGRRRWRLLDVTRHEVDFVIGQHP